MTLFNDLGISKSTLRAIEKMGFEEATPIQSETIPLALAGGDVIGQAQTGTGKTVAFGVPMIEKINPKVDAVQGLIIAPTRELAIQVSEELYKLGSDQRIRVLSVFGGQDISRQIRALKKAPHIIVGTPGRLLDHINRRTVHLNTVRTVVLDEADEMLNMGFIEDIEAILAQVPDEHQTLLFSATMPEPIRRIASRFMNEPQTVKIKTKEMTVSLISQYYVRVSEREKFDAFTRLLDIHTPELAIVFGRTKRRVDELVDALSVRGYNADGIHGDLTQTKRLQVLKKFKEGGVEILVATDVAARGLDISGVSHVYNFDIPQDPESYVHRIGRTGRAGKEGMAITFVNPREMSYLEIVEKTTKRKMERLQPPTATDALESQRKQTIEKIITSIHQDDLSAYISLSEQLLEEASHEQVIAACMKLIIKEPDEKPVSITEERPLPFKRVSGSNDYNRNRSRDTRSGSGGGGYNRSGDRRRTGEGDRKRTYNDSSRRSSDSARPTSEGRRSSDTARPSEGRRYTDRRPSDRTYSNNRKNSNSSSSTKE